MAAKMRGQLWLCLAWGASGLKEDLTGQSRGPGAEGTPCCFCLPPLSFLFRAAPPAWPQPHGWASAPAVQEVVCPSVHLREVSPACSHPPEGAPSSPSV